MTGLKVIQVGDSVGVKPPKDVLARLKVAKGDSLVLTEAPHGCRIQGDPGVADLAAACAFGLARNHSFVDGTSGSPESSR